VAAFPDRSVARLRTLPWDALEGTASALADPIASVLAGSPAERVLDRFLRSHRDLSAAARQCTAESIFGVGLWRERLRRHVGPDAPPLGLLGSLVRDLAGRPDAERLCGLPEGTLPPPVAPPSDLAGFYSLPSWLGGTLEREVGSEAPLLADALGLPGPVFLRVNRARAGRGEIQARLAADGVETRPTSLAPDGLEVLSPRPNLLTLGAFREGLLEVQDEGSQLLGESLLAGPGDVVLDLCAGAGGKTLQLAAAVGRAGAVHACDPDGARLERLRTRAARAGAEVRVHGAHPPEGLLDDRVLVDAPCSELGALRRGPDQRFRIDPAGFDSLPRLQLDLLEQAARHVRPGGRLVYATCTFRREENEERVRAFGRRSPGFTISDTLPGLADPGGPLRLLPHRQGTDGFFAAAWTRLG